MALLEILPVAMRAVTLVDASTVPLTATAAAEPTPAVMFTE